MACGSCGNKTVNTIVKPVSGAVVPPTGKIVKVKLVKIEP
jgi:hypothetical protein